MQNFLKNDNDNANQNFISKQVTSSNKLLKLALEHVSNTVTNADIVYVNNLL